VLAASSPPRLPTEISILVPPHPLRRETAAVRPATQPTRLHRYRSTSERAAPPPAYARHPLPGCTVTSSEPEQPTTRLYSTNESVMYGRRCHPRTSYPSMGFVPLQGPPHPAVPLSPEDRFRGPFCCNHFACGACVRASSLSEFATSPHSKLRLEVSPDTLAEALVSVE
jgi:hypothetical protein